MAQVEIVDYLLRGSIGGATPPDPEDFIELGPRSVAGLLIPADWTGVATIQTMFDLGSPGGVHGIVTFNTSGLAGTIRTFTRGESVDLVPVNRFALFPSTQQGVDRTFKLITMGVVLE